MITVGDPGSPSIEPFNNLSFVILAEVQPVSFPPAPSTQPLVGCAGGRENGGVVLRRLITFPTCGCLQKCLWYLWCLFRCLRLLVYEIRGRGALLGATQVEILPNGNYQRLQSFCMAAYEDAFLAFCFFCSFLFEPFVELTAIDHSINQSINQSILTSFLLLLIYLCLWRYL